MHNTEQSLNFKPVDVTAMEQIHPYLSLHTERSCDFSYGGLLMWVDMFKYEYAIYAETLFIKGLTPATGNHTALHTSFSMPIGKLPLQQSLAILQQWCNTHHTAPLTFSAVTPQYAQQLTTLGASRIIELDQWEDYIYDANALATLTGKKLSKKRNHVNRFNTLYPDNKFSIMQPHDVADIRLAMQQNIACKAAQTNEAKIEREFANKLLCHIERGNRYLQGGVLRTGNKVVAYTIGDIVADTLHIHVEKADRSIAGSFETINQRFAKAMLELHPEILCINREDDAGDPGLRYAKQTYHPLYLLKKYNITF